MRTTEERALSGALKESTEDIDFDEATLAHVVRRGRRRRIRAWAVGATLAVGMVAAAGVVVVQVWDRPTEDGATVAAPEPSASSASPVGPDPATLAAFETTRAVVAPLLAVNDSRYQEEQFHLALDYETGNAILYLPYTGSIDPAEVGVIDVEQLGADAVAAAQATPGAAPVVPVIGVALIDELDAVSVRLFQTRAEWATDDRGVYWSWPNTEDVSVTIGVEEPEVAANLPATMQLESGATATIRTEKSAPPSFGVGDSGEE